MGRLVAEELLEADDSDAMAGRRFENRIGPIVVQHDAHVGEIEWPVVRRGFGDGPAHRRFASDAEEQISGLQLQGVAGAGEARRNHTYVYKDSFHGSLALFEAVKIRKKEVGLTR